MASFLSLSLKLSLPFLPAFPFLFLSFVPFCFYILPSFLPYLFTILFHHHRLRVYPLYSGFPSPKTKFRHLSLCLVQFFFTSQNMFLSGHTHIISNRNSKKKSSPATRHGGAWGERKYSTYSLSTSTGIVLCNINKIHFREK
jgi:hypothetical protein